MDYQKPLEESRDDELVETSIEIKDTNEIEAKTASGSQATSIDDDRIPKIEFDCSACKMHEIVHYYGETPPFVHGLKFCEDTYVMQDPLKPPGPRWKFQSEYFIAIGSKCFECNKIICKDPDCSFFYTHTYCLPCAERNISKFPIEVRSKLKRQINA